MKNFMWFFQFLEKCVLRFFNAVDCLIAPPGSLQTAISNSLAYFRSKHTSNPGTFEQLIRFPEGRDVFIQFYAICFWQNMGKTFDTTPVIKAMNAVKANIKDTEQINFMKYPNSIKSIDDLIIYLEMVRDHPDILIMEM